MQQQEQLVQALLDPACYDHPVVAITVMETHISRVLLAGEFAYKLKKPVDFGFLDFSTLQRRRYFCEQELRLNRRFAPDLYLGVVTINGNPDQPVINGSGEVIEYAVKMRRFSQDGLLSRIADRHRLTARHVDNIITLVVGMHAQAGRVATDPAAGSPADIRHWVDENFEHIRRVVNNSQQLQQLAGLEDWCATTFARHEGMFAARKQQGYIRECHGDLHLGNLVVVNQRITPFDCIEFSPRLRWIDVMSEVAFLVMDIQERGYPRLAHRFLNGYLQDTGDYGGLDLLPYYLVYRALVRAKVAALRLGQVESDASAAQGEFTAYLDMATQYATRPARAIIVTHGVSGSGKSWWSEQLAERLGAIWIRSDVERKRLYGQRADADTRSAIGAGIYTPAASVNTYVHLAGLARQISVAGYPVIVDATFLKRAERDRFRTLAAGLGVPGVLLHCAVDTGVLQARLRERCADGNDPSEAGVEVLNSQQASLEPLQADEFTDWFVVNIPVDLSGSVLAARIGRLMD